MSTADAQREVIRAAAEATLLHRLARAYIDTANRHGKGCYVLVPDDVGDVGTWLEEWGQAHPMGDTR